ncbi:MAG: DMT family transporter [Candidatus Aenigmatarchaeota archaeon]|nr:DMT family transporter [Candidatus Aenigmarchaeota archaeon]
MKKETLGTIFAIITAIISGIAIPLNKIFIVNIDPLIFTAIRSIIIGIVFLFISLSARKIDKKFKTKLPNLLLIALIGGALAFYIYFSGLKMTTGGRAAFLHKTLPLYVALLSFIFLKEKIDKKLMIAIFLMFLGTISIYYGQIKPSQLWQDPKTGDLLVITATFLWAVENIIAKKVMNQGLHNFIVSFSRMFFGGLILFGLVTLTGKLTMIAQLDFIQVRNILISTLTLFSYVFFWYSSIRLINVSKATTFLLISPVISLLLGIILLNEDFTYLQLFGSFLILVGSYFSIKTKSETLERV